MEDPQLIAKLNDMFGAPDVAPVYAQRTVSGSNPTQFDPTTVFVGAMRDKLSASLHDGDRAPDTEIIRSAVDHLVAAGDVVTVDSYRISQSIVDMRAGTDMVTDPHQVLTYVQHVLRETHDHVCRHSVGDGRYRIHPDAQCSDDCATKWGYTAPAKVTPVAEVRCDSCYMTLPATVTDCPICD